MAAALQAPRFGPDELRHVMGHVPTGVSVVAGLTPEGPAGLTVGTFLSASLDPPLIGFLVARTSKSWPRVEAAETFCVSVLGEDHHHVCRRFAVSGGDKFRGLGWHESPGGAPVIDDALAWFDCRVEARHDAGDHWFVLGRVLDLGVRPAGRPLVFCHGTYRRLGEMALSVGS